jgi:hypothetical protein
MIPSFCDVAVDNSPGGNVEICLTRKGEEAVGDGGGEGVLGLLAGAGGVLAGGVLAGGVLAGGVLAGDAGVCDGVENGVLAGGKKESIVEKAHVVLSTRQLKTPKRVAAGGDGPISSADLAKHFDVTVRQVNRLIAKGMPNSSLDAAQAWKEAPRKLPPQMQAGAVKRVRQEGELTAKQLAEALGVSAPRVSQLWSEGMPRTSVAGALAWRDKNRRCSVAVSEVSDDSDDSCNSASSSDADFMELAGVDAMDLRVQSRVLSGEHSICPQLMDFCLAGVECWGFFYKRFRPFETKLLYFEPLGGHFTHDAYLRLVLAIYKRFHKSVVPDGTSSRSMLERLRQVVGRERERRAGRFAASQADTTDECYARKLQQARESTAAVRGGRATDDQARKVLLHRRTNQEYADLTAYCRVNEKMDPDYYHCFIPDLYKTGWKACQHQSDDRAERTQAKIEARRQAAVDLGVGSTILQRCEAALIVTGLMTETVFDLSEDNMLYIGVTKYTVGGRGFDSEVVRWAAVDGGCRPALTARDGSAPIMCKRRGCRDQLEKLGFTIQVLYQNVLYCNLRQVETALHVALKDCPNRLWRYAGAGGYRNRPEQIREQLDQAWLGSVFVAYAPLSLKNKFDFAPSLPLNAV